MITDITAKLSDYGKIRKGTPRTEQSEDCKNQTCGVYTEIEDGLRTNQMRHAVTAQNREHSKERMTWIFTQ